MSQLRLFQTTSSDLNRPYNSFPVALTNDQNLEKYISTLIVPLASSRIYEPLEPAIADKWLAVSALHKSIRRGERTLALQAAATLLEVDPGYLFRRLPIIAYEDIGVANPLLCAMTVFAMTKRAQDAVGRNQLAYFLVEELTVSIKSRTATDIFCLTLCDPHAKQYFDSCLSLPPAKLFDIAVDTDLNLTHRMTAIRLITGYSIRNQYGHTEAITRPNIELLNRLCEAKQVPPLIQHLGIAGIRKTEGLNGSLLLAYEMFSESVTSTTIHSELSNPFSQGVIHVALDQYCRAGREVIAEFIAESKPLRAFFARHPIKNPNPLIGTLLFQIEGCVADKQLDFDGMLELQHRTEELELRQTGLSTTNQMNVLRALLMAELPALDELRKAYCLGHQI